MWALEGREMKVLVNDGIYKPKLMDLERALQPTPVSYSYESVGVVEATKDQAELNAVAIGRLLAWFVESGNMTLDTAKFIASVTDDISEDAKVIAETQAQTPWPPKEVSEELAAYNPEQEHFKRLSRQRELRMPKPESMEDKIRRLQSDSDELSWRKNPDRNGS